MCMTVSVKWQKELYKGAEIDVGCMTSQGDPERQTILLKGATLKNFFRVNQDDSDWLKLGVKEGQKLMMIGTADEIVKVFEKVHVFMEDLSEEEQVVVVMRIIGEEKRYKILCKTFNHEAKDVLEESVCFNDGEWDHPCHRDVSSLGGCVPDVEVTGVADDVPNDPCTCDISSSGGIQ
nr:ubiquitin carboxyl-terminal hydrolase 6-like [Tanacetum cinerariifolium]